MWLQVKSAESLDRYRRQGGRYSYSVPYGHAIRWVRSSDTVVVVLWDVGEDAGYFAIPSSQVDQWHWADSGQLTTTLSFSREDCFDVAAAAKLAWISRIEHYYKIMLHAVDVAEEAKADLETDDPPEPDGAVALPMLVALGFMELVGLVRRVPGTPDAFAVEAEIKQRFEQEIVRLLEESDGTDQDVERVTALMTEAGAIAVLSRVAAISDGIGLPLLLIYHAVDVLLAMLNMWDLVRSLNADLGT